MQSRLARLVAIITDEAPLKPLNALEEKKKFLADHAYEPQFTYGHLPFSVTEFRKALEALLQEPQDDDGRISQMVQERVRELQLWLDLLENRGRDGFSTASDQLFGTPSQGIINAAEIILQLPDEEPERPLTGKDIVTDMEKALRDLGLDWKVEVRDELSARMKVNAPRGLVQIRGTAKFSEKDVKKLILHEIETHAKRYCNGTTQEADIFHAGTSNYLETEEGLAMLREEEEGYFAPRFKRRMAARALAVYYARQYGFAQTYESLRKYVDHDLALTLTMRVKRGISDTSKPGAFSKDLLYMSGYLKVKALSEEDRQYLWVGKVSVNHLPVIKELVNEGKVQLP